MCVCLCVCMYVCLCVRLFVGFVCLLFGWLVVSWSFLLARSFVMRVCLHLLLRFDIVTFGAVWVCYFYVYVFVLVFLFFNCLFVCRLVCAFVCLYLCWFDLLFVFRVCFFCLASLLYESPRRKPG